MRSVAMFCARWMRRISSRMATRVAGVERGQRLVQQQRARAEDERAGERHALLLPAGELRRQAIGEPG